MPATYETAYPRLKHSISERELQEFYAPSADEFALANEAAKGTGHKVCFLILLKTFQRLGYFMPLHDVPTPRQSKCSTLPYSQDFRSAYFSVFSGVSAKISRV